MTTGPTYALVPRTLLDDPHTVDLCDVDWIDSWKIICSCGWEAWGYKTEESVRAIHAAHKLNPVPNDPVAT